MISIIITQISSECPNPDVLKPCHCEELYERITCDGTQTTDLKAILHKISPTLKTGQKHFQQIDLINTGIKELQESTFEDITFDSIRIENAHDFTQIHTKAFNGIEKTLKELAIHNTSLKNSPPNHNIFEAIRSMHNIEHVYIFYSQIEEIPENAFI